MTAMISVGDRWRASLRIPVFGTIGLAGLFLLCTVPVKEEPSLFNHAPWLNDPFDTVISFMMFFVPFVALLCIPRVLLCRRALPLPATRIRDVLRGIRVVLVGVGVTLVSEWIALAIRDNQRAWNGATWLQVGVLATMTSLTIGLAAVVYRTGLPGASDLQSSDLLGDVLALVGGESWLFGPARQPVSGVVAFVDERVLTPIRKHPLWSAFCACALFGAGVSANQGVREGYTRPVTITVAILLTTGMFGLVVASGDYLGLVHSQRPVSGARRRAVDALVVTCIGVLVPFALRYHLWWVVSSNNQSAGLTQLVELLAISAPVIFGASFAVEAALGVHPRNA